MIVIVHLVVMHVERIPLQSDRVVPGPETPWAKELWEFVAETDEAAVFTFRKPRVLQLYGGRRAIWSREWDTARSEYLIELLEYGPTQAVPVGGATLLFENEGFRVYRRPDGN